ncbi:MAG: hypothetical protein Sapg2KO_39890 [Saprospiraceae bacterium]
MKYSIFWILLISLNGAFGQVQMPLEDAVIPKQKEEKVIDDLASIDSLYLEKRLTLTRQQNWIKLGFALILLLLFSGTLFLWWKQNQLKQQFQIQTAKEELLHLQMNPHFLFNALSSIQSLLFDQQDKILALQYLSKFAHLMRVVLANAQETQVTVASEVQMLEHYLSIQQLRFEHLFDFEIDVASSILIWKTFIPPFLIQPFIETAIEQGQFNKVNNAWIKIQIKKEKGLILLMITNNGWQDFSKKINLKETTAIQLSEQRLKIINKIWRKPIQIIKPEKSAEIIFKIPIE